ncbi:IclR family transcriptional regulator [Croceicoccus sp. Ery5]|uniref:IclR family transcriptional regulator n=1 Tax=Croceicoccus sp. Ery5 TaxID=1703340 RepID=UPI001E40D5E4|nr:IclR family transcriptional regulator C-terminal domain-containing protein [Croceicoccus sp. Ery5]
MTVLRVVNQAEALSMMQISKAVGIPYPTTCRIVNTLIDEGMLEREPSRKYYRPTAFVNTLSQGYKDHNDLVGIARPKLESLTAKHFWPVSLTTRVGQHMLVRDCTHSASPMALTNYQPGAAFPLIECASGHVVLAYSDEEQRQAWLDAAAGLDNASDPLIIERLRDPEFSETVRAQGYVLRGYNRFTNTPGRTSSIAVPIFSEGEICGALTLVFFSVSMKQETAIERYLPDLNRAARAITVKLAEASGDTARDRADKGAASELRA